MGSPCSGLRRGATAYRRLQHAEPEGAERKGTKSNKTRRVGVADRVLPLVRTLTVGRDPDDLLFVTSSGHKLYAGLFTRTLGWQDLAAGRRIHDLRHTAACLWLDGARVDCDHQHLHPLSRHFR